MEKEISNLFNYCTVTIPGFLRFLDILGCKWHKSVPLSTFGSREGSNISL